MFMAFNLYFFSFLSQCPAIDYTRHTLDGAASLLNSNKYFPSRVSIKESSVAKLGSVCRRVYRIFSHAYFHHKALYDEFEVYKMRYFIILHLCYDFNILSLHITHNKSLYANFLFRWYSWEGCFSIKFDMILLLLRT